MRLTVRSAVLALAIAGVGACGGSSTPAAPSAPGSDLAEQFDALWNTFDQQYSYFDHKQIDWNALKDRFRAAGRIRSRGGSRTRPTIRRSKTSASRLTSSCPRPPSTLRRDGIRFSTAR